MIFGLLVAASLGSTAHAWWNDEWIVRKKVTLDTTDKGIVLPSFVTGAPVLVRLHEGNFKFDQAKEDGSDLRFVAADDKTLLPYHIEKWDSLMGEAFAWVKLPEVKPGAQTSFWIYAGNSGPKAVKADDSKATFSPGTALVYHFDERGVPAVDASGNGANALNAGLAADNAIIGTGLKLNGKVPLTLPAAESLSWVEGGTLTWSAWVKPGLPQPNASLFTRRDGDKFFRIGIDNGVFYVEVGTGGAARRSQGGAVVAPNGWHHLALVAEGGKITRYLDGAPYGTLLDAPLPGLNTPSVVGGEIQTGSTEATSGDGFFQGEIDELVISKPARSVAEIKLAATLQGGDKAASALVYGEEEQHSSPFSGGYFGVIIKNLSVDGWIVIGILAVMACISWYVMLTKVSYLNAVSEGNALFLEEWRQIAKDLTELDDADSSSSKVIEASGPKSRQRILRHAPLFRIYHRGVEEIRRRVVADEGSHGSKGLSGRSIQAIRAVLDGGLVRETQRINKKIVLLTICISGGPFLGLLGTVVGVMITFAAVAAAGEVNVSAIAPGIAAALLATVAGLAVAIPSLFGYNYILTRVKESTSDMYVFIDEFVTRMAELYRE